MPKRWNIQNISVERYERLSQLRQPVGYVCFFRDSNTGNFFIGDSYHPKVLVRYWEDRAPNRYRLVRIFKADNAVELKKFLHQRYRDKWIRQHLGWFRLDNAQLLELDNFIEQRSKQLVANATQLERWNLKYFSGDFYKHLPKYQLPAGYVYVVRDLYTENYKIGYTNHPSKRIRWLEEKASGEVEYVHILQSDHVKETEAFLHKRFNANRTRLGSEWFQLNDAHLQEVRKLAGQRPRSSQAPSERDPSQRHSYQRQPPPTASSFGGHRGQQLTADTQPSRLQLPRTRQISRARRTLGLLFSIGFIVAAVLVGKLDLANSVNSADDSSQRLATIHTPTQSPVRNTPSAANTRPTSLPTINQVP